MIIGNNNGFGKPNFVSHNNPNQANIQNQTINQNNTTNKKQHFTPTNEATTYHPNILSKEDMTNKSFAMLQERLKNGTISIEEFNRKCTELGKHSK